MADDLAEIEQRLAAALVACGEDAEAACLYMPTIREAVAAGTFDAAAFEAALKEMWKMGARNRRGSTWMGTAIAGLEKAPSLQTLREYQDILDPGEFAELRKMFAGIGAAS